MNFLENLFKASLLLFGISIFYVLMISIKDVLVERYKKKKIKRLLKSSFDYVIELRTIGATNKDMEEIEKNLKKLAQKQKKELNDFKKQELERIKDRLKK